MGNTMVKPHTVPDLVERRKAGKTLLDTLRNVAGIIFTANGAGTTTTIVGANAAPGTDDTNVIRRGEKFKLFATNVATAPLEETVFRVTAIAVGASTTVTFTPAAAVATASGNVARKVTLEDYQDMETMDRVLNGINSTVYSQARLDSMTAGDKAYAIRNLRDLGSI